MKRIITVTAGLTIGALALAGCSSGGGNSSDGVAEDGSLTLTLSAWSVATTPEFQLLADAFHEKNPNVTVEVKDYDPAEYNTLLTTDLAAGKGPDIITQKEVKFLTTFQEGGQLLDVSDVALPDGIGGADSYTVDGTAYATPYRQDSWVLFYNKDLFEQAGVDAPDGSWTWDDYDAAAEELTANLDGAKGAYEHSWQSTLQGFANAQNGADILAGDYGYMKPFYERVLKLQDDGAQESFNTVTANQLTYQGEFGKQKTAMLPMGSWFVATLIAQQASGDADDFEWGIAPAPQLDASTTGTDATPVTFGDPTGFGINANINEDKVDAAKEFLAFAASEEAATALAEIGITPALLTDPVVDAYFATEGAPQDELSKFAVQTHETLPENPASNKTAAVQNILNDMHSAILSESTSVDDAIAEAESRVASEVG
ncbi:sugar ABC transporter substrate-binding protein [Microbacterium sorbitolivorans]|uniref:Extracellular solute-binding protein n=1 Tax=Microbacterium sorbitolivorans TaxID=1867410 RepID=A0A367Y4R7_9MICO|nr:sugar ABC transporter substrate-binding protein [Microbacterium sorbitolivorans]RCK60052.1 extracellular solute-binding protein [Microbacterium sorbitolivorans]GGF42297.1 sugar ABC transporter substrate-binding protein [Microbacterium sorbitolivorans]